MPATKSRSQISAASVLSETLVRESPTGVDTAAPMTRGRKQDAKAGVTWQQIIDQTLTHWLRDPKKLEDDGIDAPSGTIVRIAMDLAEKFRDEGLPAPDWVVPDPNGGIVFERRRGEESEVFQIWEDRTVEYMRFYGTKMIERRPA